MAKDIDTVIRGGNVEALIDFAQEGNAEACIQLFDWYRIGQFVEKDEAVSTAFGLYYIIFSDKAKLSERKVEEITDMLKKLSDYSRKRVRGFLQNAYFTEDKQIYKDMLYPETILEKAKQFSHSSNDRDYDKALYYYENAASLGDVSAKGELASLYLYGIGNEKHDKDMIILEYLLEAAKSGMDKSLIQLYECYQNGIGCMKDEQKALYFLMKSKGIEPNLERISYIEKGQLERLFESIDRDRSIDDRSRKEILAIFYYYGYGVKANPTTAVMYQFEVLSSSEPVFVNVIPEQYGTLRRSVAYKLCEEILRAGIALERSGRDKKNQEAQRKTYLELARKYYIAALHECPRAAVYLLRLMLEDRDPDFLPFAAIISKYWVDNCDDSKKAINMAHYMLGLYYEYFYSEFSKNPKYSDFILKSIQAGDKKWIDNLITKGQDIDKAKSYYSKAMMIDDAARRYGMLVGFRG